MRQKTLFFSIVLGLNTASHAQTPVSPLPDVASGEPEAISFSEAVVETLKQEIGASRDPLVIYFTTFQSISAEQLFKQDNGYVFPPPKPTIQPVATVSPQAAVGGQFEGAQLQRSVIAQATGVISDQIATQVSSTILAKSVVRPHYSNRVKLTPTGTPSPTTDQIFVEWYRSQLPQQLWPDTGSSPSQYYVLFLSECWAEDMPEALEAAIGVDIITPNDRPALDRARIEIASNRAGLDLSLPQAFSSRVSPIQRENADPAIRQTNEMLWSAYQANKLPLPTVVLEKYCGQKLKKGYAFASLNGPKNLYKLDIPANLAATYYAPFFYAEVCRKKTGSKYADKSCKNWEPVQPQEVLPGLGRYRLVGINEGELMSFQYVIRGSETMAGVSSAQTITPTLEP